MTYLYPKNLKAAAQMWLWSVKDFLILTIAALVSAFLLVQGGFLLPAAVTLTFAVLTVRVEEMTVVDFIRYAVRFFVTAQQTFKWR